MKTTPQRKGETRVKAWAVIDISGALGRNPYIDVTANGDTLAIYYSKGGGKYGHKDFAGKKVIPCTITYTLPPTATKSRNKK